MSNNRVFTVSDDSTTIATSHSVTSNITLGTPEATGKLAWVQNTYASQYNHAVGCWKAFDGSGTKRQMRGGHLLLYRWFILAVVIVSFVLGGLSTDVKAYVTFPIISTVIYLTLTIWNWHVFRTNGNLLHSHMIAVPDNLLPGWTNEFFHIPIYAQITDQRLLGVSSYAVTAIAGLIEQSEGQSSIDIMVYRRIYLKKLRFPWETILHFIIFIIIFIVALSRVIAVTDS
jgi:hypothetical protein